MTEIITDLEQLSESCIELDMDKDMKLAKSIIKELEDTIKEKNLIALSAPQIGYDKRIFCVKYKTKGKRREKDIIRAYINPIITNSKGMTLSRESDACFPGEYITVRNQGITIVYQNNEGRSFTQEIEGKAVAVVQQMVDHLDGILLNELGLEIDELFDKATEEEKNELLEAYMKSLEECRKEIDNQIEEDKDLKQIKDAVDFIQSVRDGSTKLDGTITIEKEEENND